MGKKIFCVFVLFLFQNLLAQEDIQKILNGKVVVEGNSSGFVKVINLNAEKEVTTDYSGYFTISAQKGDILIFSGDQLKMRQITLKEENFKEMIFVVDVRMVVTQLDEVVVTKSKITAKSLGIIQEDIVLQTVAERRLNQESFLGLGGLINAFSGRTSMLKDNLAVEKKNSDLEDLQILFGEEFYVNQIKIPKEYIKAFQYYCIEDRDFVKTLVKGDKSWIKFSLVDMARRFKVRNSSGQ